MKQSDFMVHLRDAMRDSRVSLSGPQAEQLAAHWELLCQWGDRMNLTAIETAEQAAWRHYRDSLEGAPLLAAGPVADIGSGAGFPGLPLAVVRPEIQFTLVEPRRKRVSFLRAAIAKLRLANVRVLMGRSEDPPDRPYAAIVTRATFSDTAALQACAQWLAPGGQILAFRSPGAPALAADQHTYDLNGDTRVIEIWRP